MVSNPPVFVRRYARSPTASCLPLCQMQSGGKPGAQRYGTELAVCDRAFHFTTLGHAVTGHQVIARWLCEGARKHQHIRGSSSSSGSRMQLSHRGRKPNLSSNTSSLGLYPAVEWRHCMYSIRRVGIIERQVCMVPATLSASIRLRVWKTRSAAPFGCGWMVRGSMNMFNPESFNLVLECTLKLVTVVAGEPRRTTTVHQPRVMERTSNRKSSFVTCLQRVHPLFNSIRKGEH